MYYVVELAAERCTGCRRCIRCCPDPNVISYLKETKTVGVDAQRCKGCGICVSSCPKDALSVQQP